MEVWLSFNNGAERLQLPVTPETIAVSYGQIYEDVEVSQLGDYTIIKDGKATEFSFDSHFPAVYDPSYCSYENVPNPKEAVAMIQKWLHSGKPLRLTITDTPINYAVTIRTFDTSSKAGSVDDIYFSLALREYVFVTFQTIDLTKPVVKDTTTNTSRPPANKASNSGKSYTVKSGDTLWKIAQKQLGKGSRWKEIYDKNKKVIGSNPNKIKPGQKLVLP